MEAVDAAAQYKNSGKLETENAERGGIEEQQKVAISDATVTLVYLNLNTKILNPKP